MKRGVYLLPSLLTSGSLFCGFYAIIAAFKGEYLYATVAIAIAFVFDGVDGKVARLTKTTSRFGVEYDSLSDLVAFGVAPAILVFSWALRPYGRWGWLAAFLYVACGALRLARFNVQVDTMEPRHFRGLPIPGAAGLIAATFLFFRRLGIAEGEPHNLFILLLIFLLTFLMVSNIKYPSLKNLELLKRKPFNTLVAIILTIVVVAAEPAIMLFIFACLYFISGPVEAVREWYKKRVTTYREKKIEPLAR